MTLMRIIEITINIIAQNRAAVGIPNVVRSQMNLEGQSPKIGGKLAVFSPEIGSPITSIYRFEVNTIDILDLGW